MLTTRITIRSNADWLQTFVFGSTAERWRLDDWDVEMHVKAPADLPTVLFSASTEGGDLTITDPVGRRLDLSVPRETVEAFAGRDLVFDFHRTNKSTGVQVSSETIGLSIVDGITFPEA
jgi:hypothetical protein